MRKLRQLGGTMRLIYVLCLCVLPIYVILFWLTNGYPFGGNVPLQIFLYEGPSLPPIAMLPLNLKIYGLLVNLIPVSLGMLLLAFLIRLFHRFSQGEIISTQIVKLIRYIAWTFLWIQLIRPFYSLLMSFVLTLLYPVKYRFAYLGISVQDILMIFVAATLLLIAWVFAEYYKMHKEQEFTV